MKMFKTAATVSVFAFAGLANASSNTSFLRVNVPFGFVVGGQDLQPGEYTLYETDGGVLTVQGEGKTIAVITTPGKGGEEVKKTSLRFTNAANHEYLVGVGVEGEGSRSVPVPSAEGSSAAVSH
jgi:hypothetical protein